MRKYKSHKTAEAFKIIDIIAINPTHSSLIGDGIAVEVTRDFFMKHNPYRGGYYVKYQDGYDSFSPAEAFEDGYTEIGTEPLEPKKELDYGQLVNLRMKCLEKAVEIHSFQELGYSDEKKPKEELRETTEEFIKIALGD